MIDITMIVPYTVPAIVSGSPSTRCLSRSRILAGMFAEPTSDQTILPDSMGSVSLIEGGAARNAVAGVGSAV
jgi:hypothetical protein